MNDPLHHDDQLRERIAHYLHEQLGRAVEIGPLKRFAVGFSWRTYLVPVIGFDGPGTPTRDIILRLGPDYGLFAPYSAIPEWLAMRSLEGTAIPVPKAYWASDDERLNNGFIMLGIGRGGDATGKGSDKKNAKREQERGEFRLAYMAAERELVQSMSGKNPSPEQKDALIRNLARSFRNLRDEGKLYQTVDGKRVGIFSMDVEYATQISEADRAAVRDAWIKKYNRPPTEAQVKRYIIDARGGAAQ